MLRNLQLLSTFPFNAAAANVLTCMSTIQGVHAASKKLPVIPAYA